MGSSSRLVAFAAVAVVVGAGAWYGLAGRDVPTDETASGSQPAAGGAAAGDTPPRFEAGRDDLAPLAGADPASPLVAPADPAAAAPAAAEPALASLGRVVGRVTRKAGGAPVAGLTVELDTLPGVPCVPAFTNETTDAEGRFRFALAVPVRVNSIHVQAGAETRDAHATLGVSLEPGQELVRDIEVALGATASGRVVDGGGQPVAGARVRGWNVDAYVLEAKPDRRPDQEATTDGSGEFRVGGLGPSCVLTADAAGRTAVERLSGQLASGAVAEGLVLTLGPARELRGVVLGPDETAVADCRIDVGPGSEDGHGRPSGVPGLFFVLPPRAQARSDASGRFVLPGLAELPYQVNAWSARYVPWEGRHAPGDPELVVRLEAGTALTGEVVSARGGPVEDAEVTIAVMPEPPWPRAIQQVRTDAEGRFEASGLTPDEHGAVLVSAEGHALHFEQPVVFTAEGPNHVRIVLAEERRLAGVVVDASERPLAGRMLKIVGDRVLPLPPGMTVNPIPTWEGLFPGANLAQTDEDGRFVFERLYDGLFELRVAEEGGGGVAASVQARSGSEDLRIVVGAAGSGVTLYGSVRDATTGQPVESFDLVAMIPNGEGGMSGDDHAFASPEGAFRVTGLPAGPIQPWLRAPGYSDLHVPVRDYAEGEHRLDLTMSADRTLHLRVLDEDREPVEGAMLSFRDEAGESLWIKSGPHSGTTSLETDAQGEVIAMGLPAALVTARVRTGHFSPAHEFRFDLRHELRGVQVLVLGDEGGQTTVLVFFFGTSEAPAPGAEAQDFSTTMQGLKTKLAAGTVWPIDAPLAVRALAADGQVLAQQAITPGESGPDSMPLPDVAGVCNVKLTVPAEPLEIEAAAAGYASVRRAWQPDRSSDTGDVVILLLRRN